MDQNSPPLRGMKLSLLTAITGPNAFSPPPPNRALIDNSKKRPSIKIPNPLPAMTYNHAAPSPLDQKSINPERRRPFDSRSSKLDDQNPVLCVEIVHGTADETKGVLHSKFSGRHSTQAPRAGLEPATLGLEIAPRPPTKLCFSSALPLISTILPDSKINANTFK
jgi:hypothetical protein